MESFEEYMDGATEYMADIMAKGVQLPGSPEFERGFIADNGDFREIAAREPTVIIGVQLPGNPIFERGFGFGEDEREMAKEQEAPPTNQDFGVESDGAPPRDISAAHGDEAGMSLIGADNDSGPWGGPTESEILAVFTKVKDHPGSYEHEEAISEGIPQSPGTTTPIVRAPGSGVIEPGRLFEENEMVGGDDHDEDDMNAYPRAGLQGR